MLHWELLGLTPPLLLAFSAGVLVAEYLHRHRAGVSHDASADARDSPPEGHVQQVQYDQQHLSSSDKQSSPAQSSPEGLLSFSDWTSLNSYANLQDIPALQRRLSTARSAKTDKVGALLEPGATLDRTSITQAPSTGAVGDDAGHLGDSLSFPQAPSGNTEPDQEDSAQSERAQSNSQASSSRTSPHTTAFRPKRTLALQNGGKLPLNDSASSWPEWKHSEARSDVASDKGSQHRDMCRRQDSLHSPPITSDGPDQAGDPQQHPSLSRPSPPSGRPPVLAFSAYAACRFLSTTPENRCNGQIYEALKTMAAFYLRADTSSICDCLSAFGLNDLLFDLSRYDLARGAPVLLSRSASRDRKEEPPGCSGDANGSESLDSLAAVAQRLTQSSAMHRRKHSPMPSSVFDTDSASGSDSDSNVVPKHPRHSRRRPPIANGPTSRGSGTRLDEQGSGLALQRSSGGFRARSRQGSGDVPTPLDSAASWGIPRMEALRGVVRSLMHELECLLHEYLSYNWDRVEEVLDANRHLLRDDGLVCAWPRNGLSQAVPLRSSSLSTSPHGLYRATSGDSASYVSEADPTNEEMMELESFDEFLANRVGGQPMSPRHPQALPRSPSADDGRWQRQEARRRAMKNWQRAKVAVTRKITQDMLGVQRRFQTLRQMFQELNRASPKGLSQRERRPVLLMLGGGMAAGKSTVREIIGQDNFWTKMGTGAVVIEADAIKNRDAVYRTLQALEGQHSESEKDLSQYVHDYSTRAAESMLVTAVNMQKDIIFDGTMTWAPFVEQTVAMVRDHRNNYRMGPGYHKDSEGNVIERYWEVDENNPVEPGTKRPYQIELMGVTCDAGLAVARGIWRKIRTGRSVPVASQLRSHRLFSENWESLAHLVDMATLYNTGSALTSFNKGHVDLTPKVIAHRSKSTRGEMLVNPAAYSEFCRKTLINDKADCRHNMCGHASAAGAEDVPTSDCSQMGLLRCAFRAADRKERAQLRRMNRRSCSRSGGSSLETSPAPQRASMDL